MEGFFLEKNNIKMASVPVDGNTAAISGARISMKTGERLVILCAMGDSTGATVEFAIKQHNASSGGTTKALATLNPYFHKVGAATSFTKVEPTVATDTYTLTTLFTGDEGLVAFEVLQEDLDVDNNFSHVSVEVTDAAAAKIMAPLYIVHQSKSNPAYSTAL